MNGACIVASRGHDSDGNKKVYYVIILLIGRQELLSDDSLTRFQGTRTTIISDAC